MTTQLESIRNPLLQNFINSCAWERGHSAGKSEVDMIAESLAYDLKLTDEYITKLEAENAKLSHYIECLG